MISSTAAHPDPTLRGTRRLRFGIVAVAAALFVAYAANEYARHVEDRAATLEEVVNEARTMLVSLDEHVIQTMRVAESTVEQAANEVEKALRSTEFDSVALGDTLQRLRRAAPHLRSLVYVDAHGLLHFAPVAPALPRGDFRDREYFEFHRDSRYPYVRISEPSRSRVADGLIVPISRRVNDADGEFAGVILGVLPADYFTAFYGRLGQGRMRAFAIFGSNATLLARAPNDPTRVGTSFSQNLLFRDHLAQRPEGSFRRPADPAGPTRHVVYRRVHGAPFVLATTIDENAVLSAWRERARSGAAQVTMIGLVLLVLCAILLRAIHRQERLARGLAESEAQYRDLLEASSDWHWEMGPDLRFTKIRDERRDGSSFYANLVGCTRTELVDIPGTPGLRRHLDDLAQRRPFRDFVYRRILKDGSVRYTKSSGKPRFGAGGEFLGYRGTASDVTTVMQADDRAAASRKLLNEAVETLHEGFVLFDAQDRFVLCNGKYREIYAQSAALLVPGVHYETILRHAAELGQFPEALGRIEKWIKKALAYHHIMSSTRQRQLPDGRWVEVREVKLADGGSAGIHIDITEAKLAQEQLRESEERLRHIAANLTQVILEFSVDKEGVIRQTFVSDRCRDVLGYTAEEIMADPMIFARIIEPEFLAAYCQTLAEAERSMMPVEVEYRFKRRDGESRWARSLLRPRQGPEGAVLWDGTINDATEEKAAEGQRREMENQLRHLQRIEAVGTLAGGMAHEINNKLVPIVTFSELMLMKAPESDPNRKPLHTIHEAAERIRDLVARILTMSRSETLGTAKIELRGVAGNVLALLRATLPPNIRLSLEAGAPGCILGDASQLEQVLTNLCTNAAHAIGRRQGHIRICVDEADSGGPGLPPGRYVRLRVTDDGPGMDTRTLERIFEPFFTTKPVGEGTGLGLSIVHGIVASHQGRITVESTVGQGTTFTIVLPVAANDDRAAPALRVAAP